MLQFHVGAAIGFVAGLTLGAFTCKAEELSHINARNAAYCSLYSREAVRIEITHPTESWTADTDIILGKAQKAYGECISVLPTLLPLPAKLGELEAWLADMRDLIILRAGTKPAAAEAPPKSTSLSDEEWRAQCRSEYNTWDEDSGTVIRRGSSGRVRCPCGTEVTCP